MGRQAATRLLDKECTSAYQAGGRVACTRQQAGMHITIRYSISMQITRCLPQSKVRSAPAPRTDMGCPYTRKPTTCSTCTCTSSIKAVSVVWMDKAV